MGIIDASLAIDDFQALAPPVGAKSLTSLQVIDTKTGRAHPFDLPAGSTLLGRIAGVGPAALSDALACDLQFVWFVHGRQVGGIDPLHPAGDTFHSAGFVPGHVPREMMAISCSGDQLAIYRPLQGLVIYQIGFAEGGGGRVLRRFAVRDVSFLS
jgi:hypothetical protein